MSEQEAGTAVTGANPTPHLAASAAGRGLVARVRGIGSSVVDGFVVVVLLMFAGPGRREALHADADRIAEQWRAEWGPLAAKSLAACQPDPVVRERILQQILATPCSTPSRLASAGRWGRRLAAALADAVRVKGRHAMAALGHARAEGSEARIDAVLGPHYPWCDPVECTRFGTGFYPNNRPQAHLSRRYDSTLGDESRTAGVVAQLVQYVGDPRPQRHFVRLEASEPDERTVVYIEREQSAALGAALTQIAALPDTSSAPEPTQSGAPPTGQETAGSLDEPATPSDPAPAPASANTATVKESAR
jgi:hypothetical protein